MKSHVRSVRRLNIPYFGITGGFNPIVNFKILESVEVRMHKLLAQHPVIKKKKKTYGVLMVQKNRRKRKAPIRIM